MPDKKKTEKYESERNLIYERLMNMLNYHEDHSFTLDELDKNTELQNQKDFRNLLNAIADRPILADPPKVNIH
jgi:hypothetical protein